MYTKKLLKHFHRPHNYGKMRNPDGTGKVGNIVCGDVMWLYIKVRKNKKGKEIIQNIKFETFGCVAAIATSSIITDIAKGKTLDDAMKIKKEQILRAVGNLPPVKIHCSVLAVDALSEAMYDYFSKNQKIIPKKLKLHHQRILEEKKIIERKYKEWTDIK